MIPTLRSEFKKLFSIRSTYFFILLALVIVGIYSFYGEGFKDSAALLQTAHHKHGPLEGEVLSLFIAGTITVMSHFISLFAGIIALLLITHEYRYNTITYTLASNNSRSKVLASKLLTVMGFVLVYSLILVLYGIGMIYLGLHFSHNVLPHQTVDFVNYVAKIIFHAEGYALAALLFGALIRNQVGSFAALLIIPGPVEGLLSLILRHDSVYLPFMSLDQVIQAPTVSPPNVNEAPTGYLSPGKGALVYICYLIVGWAVAWYLFLHRDATKSD